MKHLSTISYTITIAGVLLITITVFASLSAVFMLTGMLLVLAGLVKIAVVQIWQRIAGL